jgi:trimethyllysine dioxygenase
MEASPNVAGVCPTGITPSSVQVKAGALSINWGENDPVKESTFEPEFLRAYAKLVAKPLETAGAEPAPKKDTDTDWVKPYDGLSKAGIKSENMVLLKNDDKHEIPSFTHASLEEGSNHLKLLRTLLETHGVAIINEMPDDPECDGSVLADFNTKYLGGLQKHPLRDTAHWRISTEEAKFDESAVFSQPGEAGKRTGSNSFNTNQQLCNHTDQSLYGTPGVLLMFHCAFGQGMNTITDGFAVATKLRNEYPEYYEMLSKHGMNAGRELTYYRAGDITFTTNAPVLHTDANGDLSRVQYHEIYRAPLTLSYDEFEKWYPAFGKFYELVHSPEFMRPVSVSKGQLIIFNNWRTMHGRAGLKGKARTILGGTVSRDGIYSAARGAIAKKCRVKDIHCGAPTFLLPDLSPELELELEGARAKQAS